MKISIKNAKEKREHWHNRAKDALEKGKEDLATEALEEEKSQQSVQDELAQMKKDLKE